MERKQFSEEEKEFFRRCFPRFNRESVFPLVAGKRCDLVYHDSEFMGDAYGYIMEFGNQRILMWINGDKSKDEIGKTIIHEMLHKHYVRGWGRLLYSYLCIKEGYPEMLPLWSGEVYWNQWESFLDEETERIYREDPGIVDKIKGYFKEIAHRRGWKKFVVDRGEGLKEEWIYV